MPLFRRFGRPGLLGTVARTAVVAGTATVTARAIGQGMNHRQTTSDEATAYEAEAERAPGPPTAATASETSLIEQLKSLNDLKRSGAISEDEFTKAKGLLLSAH